MSQPQKGTTEIIVVCSGKGGTGKTLITACLGYALTRAQLRVLLIDTDLGTDGLSLFLLGPGWKQQIDQFTPLNTFSGMLKRFQQTERCEWQARQINRTRGSGGPDNRRLSMDHGVVYEATLISKGRSMYGDREEDANEPAVPHLTQAQFRKAIAALFQTLRDANEYDYVLVDTRGGFGFETTDMCALADSFLIVTEADYTSFYQDRNLVNRINAAGGEMNTKSLLRAIIVNKATEGEEKSFRVELEKEFHLRYENTYAAPLDLDAILAYKMQQMPYVSAPGCDFANATLAAFAEILHYVTARWEKDQIDRWNRLVDEVSEATKQREEKRKAQADEELRRQEDVQRLKADNVSLKAQVESLRREVARADDFVGTTKAVLSQQPIRYKDATSGPELETVVRQLASPKRTSYLVLGAVIITSILTGIIYVYIQFGPNSERARLKTVYSRDEPPEVRIKEMVRLYKSNRRSFEGVELPRANFSGLKLQDINLQSAKLEGATFTDADLRGANLQRALLEAADFGGAQMEQANLASATLSSASLIKANLSLGKLQGAKLVGSRMVATILRDADLTGADLARAQLTAADLRGAELQGANLRLADLTGAKVTTEQLARAIVDDTTILGIGTALWLAGPFSDEDIHSLQDLELVLESYGQIVAVSGPEPALLKDLAKAMLLDIPENRLFISKDIKRLTELRQVDVCIMCGTPASEADAANELIRCCASGRDALVIAGTDQNKQIWQSAVNSEPVQDARKKYNRIASLGTKRMDFEAFLQAVRQRGHKKEALK